MTWLLFVLSLIFVSLAGAKRTCGASLRLQMLDTSQNLYVVPAVLMSCNFDYSTTTYGGHVSLTNPIDACSNATRLDTNPNFDVMLTTTTGCGMYKKLISAKNLGANSLLLIGTGNEYLPDFWADYDIFVAFIDLTDVDPTTFASWLFVGVQVATEVNSSPVWFIPVLIVIVIILATSSAVVIYMFILLQRRRRIAEAGNGPVNALSPKEMQLLPTRLIEEADKSEDKDCAVCLDNFECGGTIRVLPCSHYFHQSCIDPWLLNHNRNCPVCKADAGGRPSALTLTQVLLFSMRARRMYPLICETAGSSTVAEGSTSRSLRISVETVVVEDSELKKQTGSQSLGSTRQSDAELNCVHSGSNPAAASNPCE